MTLHILFHEKTDERKAREKETQKKEEEYIKNKKNYLEERKKKKEKVNMFLFTPFNGLTGYGGL